MAKRTRRPVPAKAAPREDSTPHWPRDRHSGEGSASALEILHKLEQQRVASLPADPGPEDAKPPQD